jgi:hypothetical protein
MENLQDTDMARPKTKSKPKPKQPKPEPEVPLVRVQNRTGEDVPDAKAEKIAAAHLAGMSVRQICRAFNTSHHTVTALIRNRPELMERARDVTARNWRTIAAIGTAEILDRIPDMKDQGLVIMAAVATDKSELLSGGATQRVEHVMAPAADAWASFVSGLKSEQVIDVEFQPVGSVSAAPQKAAALPDAAIEIETSSTEESER